MITHSDNMDIQGYTQMLLSRNELECAELMQDAVLPEDTRETIIEPFVPDKILYIGLDFIR